MNKRQLYLITVTVLTLMLASINANAQTAATSTVFATGLRGPGKIITSPKGNLLVSEAGSGLNSGRISILDLSGNRRTLLDGLPAGFAPPNNDLSGPSGLAMRGRTLFVLIGAGDGEPLQARALALGFDDCADGGDDAGEHQPVLTKCSKWS